MFFAEVLSGSSPFWVFVPESIIITTTIYLTHTLFFYNIAVRFRRETIVHLYFLGIVYGLYEAWITKVIVVGYINTDPILGSFHQIAIAEFILLVLFWHPIMSFIMPLATIRVLLAKDSFIPKINIIYYITAIIGAIILAAYLNFNPINFIVSSVSTLAVPTVIYILTMKKMDRFSLDQLKLSNKALIIVFTIMLIPYVYTFPIFRDQPLVDSITLMIILLFYLIGIVGFFILPPALPEYYSYKSIGFIMKAIAIFFSFGVILSFIPTNLILILTFAILMTIGTFILIFSIIFAIIKRIT